MAVIFQTVVLLVLSNVFMTFAWYAHLGGQGRTGITFLEYIGSLQQRPWILAVVVSWGIAFVEYLFQVPANRIGSTALSKAQLKILQEVISLTVFLAIAIWYWGEPVSWNYVWAGLCILAAVFFVFRKTEPVPGPPPAIVEAEGKAMPHT